MAILANNINIIKAQIEEMKQTAEVEKQQMDDSKVVAPDVAQKAADIQNNTPVSPIPIEPNMLQTNSIFLSKVDFVQGTQMAGSCISSFLSVIPSTFYYKKTGDAGVFLQNAQMAISDLQLYVMHIAVTIIPLLLVYAGNVANQVTLI